MSNDPKQGGNSLERALEQARAALAGDDDPGPPAPVAKDGHGSDGAVERARSEAREVLGKLPANSPARVTRTFAYVLDDLVRVPGTNFRLGVDPLLSFVPFAGTAVGAAFGTVVLVDAVRLRAPIPVVTRMMGNYLIDWLLGLVPFAGGFLDMAYRSNAKNLKLLTRTIEDRAEVRKASVTYWLSIAVLTAVLVLAVLAVPVALLVWLGSMGGGQG